MALSTDDCTQQQQQVYSTDCMNPTFFARRNPLSSSSPPTPPPLPLPQPIVERLPPHHDNESFDDSPPTLLSHKPLRGGYHHHYHPFATGGGIQGCYPSPPSASANPSTITTTTNLDDSPYDLFYDYPYLKQHPTAALFGGHHVAGYPPSRIDTTNMTSTPSSMAVSTPSLSPSSPLSAFNEYQSPPPLPPYPTSAPGRRGNGLELLSEEDADADALLSPLSPEWGATALTANNITTNPDTAATTTARHGILGLPTHSRNIERPSHHPPSSTLLPPPSSSTLSPILSPSEPLGDFDELVAPMGSDSGGSRYHDQSDNLWDSVGEDDDDDDEGFLPLFLNLSTFDAFNDDLWSPASTSGLYTSRPILSLLDIPPPRSGTTTATRSRATSRSRSRSPYWEYPPLPRSSTPSVAGVRDHGDDEDADAEDVDRIGGEGDDDDDMLLDGQGEDREFIVSPPSSGPPDTPSTPTELPTLPFLDLFDDDEEQQDEDLIPPRSQKGAKTQCNTNEDVLSIPGYFPHPTSPSIPAHRSIPPPYQQEDDQDRDFAPQLQPRDSPPRSSPQRQEDDEWFHHHPPSPSPPLLSLPPPFASFSPITSPPLLPHASPRPALLQLSFDDDDEGEYGSSGAASPPFSPDNNSLRLLLHNSPPRSPPDPSGTLSPSTTRSPSPEFNYEHLADLGVGSGGEYAEEVKKLVELQKRAREAERVAKEREGLVMAALQARRGARLAPGSPPPAPDSTPASDEASATPQETASLISEDEKKTTENEEVVLLQRAAAEARAVAKRERERAKEVGMLLKLKLGELSSDEEREGDNRMDTDDTTATTTATIDNAQDMDTDSSTPQPMLPSTTSPSPGSISTQPFVSKPTSPLPTPAPMATVPTKTAHPRMASIARLVAKMFFSRHEASSSSASSISSPARPTPPPTSTSPPPSPSSPTESSSSPASSSTTSTSNPITSILSSSSPSPPSPKYRNLWLKGGMLGRLGGGTGTGADRFLQHQLQQRYKFLRSSPLARNASSIDDDDAEDHDDANGGGQRSIREEEEERDDGVDGGFEALRRPIMWGMDLDEDEGLGLLPAL